MSANVEAVSSSQDTPPVCLGRENPHRLVNLWDIVNQFKLTDAAFLLVRLQAAETMMQSRVSADGGGDSATLVIPDMLGMIKDVKAFSEVNEFSNCLGVSDLAEYHLELHPKADLSSVEAEIRHTKVAFMRDIGEHHFLRIAKDRISLVDHESLFGQRVRDAFPSARQDIKESGNCLAAECSTATVFHLMRAVEYALRALALDRQIILPKNAALDLATWEDIIKQLEAAEVAIQGYPKTLVREKQFEFYHGAMMEFKRFKNVFRNSVMHTRDDYDRDQAHSVLGHVRDFMKILAAEISETKTTPMIWV